jgi:hypothetical protein
MIMPYLCRHALLQQNVTILHRMVQTLGGIKDNAELRGWSCKTYSDTVQCTIVQTDD